MPILRNPQTGEIVIAADPAGALQQGFQLATDEEADEYARQLDYGTVGQQALAQGERVVRGATLGAVDGFSGSDADVRAREEVSREQSPVTSFLADVAPDVGVAALTGGLGGLATGAGRAAARGALAEGAGALRAGLSAARAGGATALAAESLGTGLVGAGQVAHAEGSYLGEDLGRDAENILLFGGLNFGLGAFGLGKARQAAGKRAGGEAAETAAGELDDVARAAELEASEKLPTETPGAMPAAAGGVDDLSQQFNEATGLAPAAAPTRWRAILDKHRAQTGMVDLGASVTTPVKITTAADQMGLSVQELQGFIGEYAPDLWGKRNTVVPADVIAHPEFDAFIDRKAIERYTENSAFTVNQKLRSVGWDKPWVWGGEASKQEKRYFEGLKGIAKRAADVMRRAPEQEAPIFRGHTASAADLERWTKSGVVDDPAFMSFSTNESTARRFIGNENYPGQNAENGRVKVLIRSPRGGFNYGGPEAEVMFPPGSKLRVKGITQEGDVSIIDVEPIAKRAPLRAGERGMAQLTPEDREALAAVSGADKGPNFSPLDVITSPMGNVAAAGAGAAVGGQLGDQEGAIAGGATGLLASLLLGRRAGAGVRGAAKLEAAAARQAELEAADDGLTRAVRNASKADAEDIVSSAIGEGAEREASGFGRQRRLYQNRVAVMDAAEREFRGDLNGAMSDLQRVVKGEKQAVVAGKVSANQGAQRAVATGIAEQAAKFAGELRGEARAYAKASGKAGTQFAIPGAKSLAAALMDHAKAVSKATDGKAMFAALDDFKRAAQDIKVSLEAGALNSTNPIHHQQLIPRIDTFERQIRNALEDAGTWGQAGEMQRAYNGVISDKLMPSLRIFEESVMERTHRGYDGIWKMEGWENKIKGLLANTDPGRRRHAAAVFDAMDELASVRRRFGDAETAERLSTAAAKMRRTIGLADEVAEAANTVDDVGAIAGAVPLFGGMIREAVTGRLSSAVERLMSASDAAATRGVDDWIRSSRVRGGGLRSKLPTLGELSPEAKQLRDVAARRGVSQGMALFMGEDETASAAFERQRDALISDDGFFESLNDEYGDLQQESPELFMALSGRAALARGFLLQRMPANVAVSMARPLGHPPSREAIEDWAQYVNAVRFPTRIARNLAAISVQQVETLRTVHPRFYELLQQRMIEGISRAQQTGEQLDDTFLMRIGLLFPDLDGAASPVFSREFGKVIRDYNQQQRQQQGARGGAGKPGKPTPSPMLSTLENGATFGSGF